jgi:hypothetical protein
MRWLAEPECCPRQGFYGPSTPEQLRDNPYSATEGSDFSRNHGIDTIDFAVAHGALR